MFGTLISRLSAFLVFFQFYWSESAYNFTIMPKISLARRFV